MNEELLKMLICPKCEKGELEKISDDKLKCKNCGQEYLIKDNIPILLVD